MLALLTLRNTPTLGEEFGEEGGTYCAYLQMTELDHREHITGRQKLVGWKAILSTGLS